MWGRGRYDEGLTIFFLLLIFGKLRISMWRADDARCLMVMNEQIFYQST